MYWKVPNIWEGERCFIIGGGNSITEQFEIPAEVVQSVLRKESSIDTYSPFLSFLHNKHNIAVNEAFKLGKWVDILFFGDFGYWKRNTESILNFKGLRVSCCKEMKLPGIKMLEKRPRNHIGISSKPNQVCWNFNSGAAAINLAVHLGVKEIYLLGFDMNLDKDQNQHWHSSYHTDIKIVGGTFKRHLIGFPRIKEDAEKLGVKIYNVNPYSAIQCFEKLTMKEVIENWNE